MRGLLLRHGACGWEGAGCGAAKGCGDVCAVFDVGRRAELVFRRAGSSYAGLLVAGGVLWEHECVVCVVLSWWVCEWACLLWCALGRFGVGLSVCGSVCERLAAVGGV